MSDPVKKENLEGKQPARNVETKRSKSRRKAQKLHLDVPDEHGGESEFHEFVPIHFARGSDEPIDPLWFSKQDKATQAAISSTKLTQGINKPKPRYAGGGDHPTIVDEWQRQSSGWHHMMSFNLEFWWIHSSKAERIAAGMALICLAVFFVHFSCGIWFLVNGFRVKLRSPYVCNTEECKKASVWISSTMNTSKDPCDNFYEYVCGNYPTELNQGGDDIEYLFSGGYPISLGGNSILAKILKDFKNKKELDQPIRYYQACLDTSKRSKHGIGAFFEKVEHIFGTKDFNAFESSTRSLEEIGGRMMKVAGHISILSLSFHVYPFVEIGEPGRVGFPSEIYFDRADWNNRDFVKTLTVGLMKHTNVPSTSSIVDQIVMGVDVMSSLVHELAEEATYYYQSAGSLEESAMEMLKAPEFKEKMDNLTTRGLCPPMGVQLNLKSIFKHFLEDDYRLTYEDLMSAKIYFAWTACFSQPSSPPATDRFTHPKTAFVGLWLIHFFFQFHPTMDKIKIMNEWGFTREQFPNNGQVGKLSEKAHQRPEINCLISMYKYLGYIPTTRYLLSVTDNPVQFIVNIENHIAAMYPNVAKAYKNIPDDDIVTVEKHLEKNQFARGVYVDVGKPLVSGLLDTSALLDNLYITDNHLRNSLQGNMLVIETARMNWIASTNPTPTLRWFGYGGRLDKQRELLDLREPMFVPARYQEVEDAGHGKGTWDIFLKRKYPNYVLYPLSLMGQPHTEETLSLFYVNFMFKVIRSFLRMNEYQYLKDTYPSLEASGAGLVDFAAFGNPETDNKANRTCNLLFYLSPLYNYVFNKADMFEFNYDAVDTYNSIFALRHGLKLFRQRRKELNKMLFNWTLPDESMERVQDWIMRRYLPNLEKYSEDQLYFISFVRNYCRGSFKTHNDEYKDKRFKLETMILYVLMQTKEFAETWKCPKKAFMSNFGHPRCLLH